MNGSLTRDFNYPAFLGRIELSENRTGFRGVLDRAAQKEAHVEPVAVAEVSDGPGNADLREAAVDMAQAVLRQ